MNTSEVAREQTAPDLREPSAKGAGQVWRSSRVIRSAVLFAVGGVVLYGLAALASDYRAVIAALTSFPVTTLLLVLLLVVCGWLLRGWRFHYYLRQTHSGIPLGYCVEAFLAGFALTGTPGKLGEAVKGLFLQQDYGVPVTRVVGIVMVERLMDLFGVLILGSVSLLMFEGWQSTFLLCMAVVVAGAVCLCMEAFYRPVLEWLSRYKPLAWLSKRVLEVLLAGRELMGWRVFVAGLAVSTIAWGLESLCMFLIMDALGIAATVQEANFVYCFSTIVGALSMLPGGIGGTEAGMLGLLHFLEVPYALAIPAVILIRACTLWLAVAVGVGFMLHMLARTGRNGSGSV